MACGRKYYFELTTDILWVSGGRVVAVKANSLNGGFKRARKKMRASESIYQVTTRVEGCELLQPIWDCYNGDL